MQHVYRLYVGADNKTGIVNEAKALELVSAFFVGFTVTRAQGYWDGKPEASLIIEIASEANAEGTIRALSQGIAHALEQEAVMYTAEVKSVEFVTGAVHTAHA
jgi:hypothetical protein